MVSSSLNVNTLEELAAYSKAQSEDAELHRRRAIPHQLFMESFKEETGADIVRVPFKGGGDAVNGMLTGTTPVAFFGIGNFIAHLQAGTIHGIAVDADKRSPLFPDIPTLKELRPNVDLTQADFSLWAPKGTPQAIIGKSATTSRRSATIRPSRRRISSSARSIRCSTRRRSSPSISKQSRAQVERIAKKANLQPQ